MEPLAEILRETRDRITDEEHWCKGTLAQGVDEAVFYTTLDPEATKFCVLGSLAVTLRENLRFPTEGGPRFTQVRHFLDLNNSRGWTSWRVNDLLGHEAVMDMLDKCIKIADDQGLEV